MRRKFVVLTIACALGVSMALSNATGTQTGRDRSSPKVKEVKVTAQTLAKLPADGKYVVDLTRKGTIYEFDPTAGRIDFQQVVVRTAAGEEAIEPRMKKALSNKELNEWYLGGFRIGTTSDFRTEGGVKPSTTNPSSTRKAFTCDPNACTCRGQADCDDLWDSGLCDWIPCTRRGGGPIRCICFRNPL
jgi:hypothetical protein